MEVNDVSLEKFGQWLVDMGRSPGTVRLYPLLVGACARHEDGITGRLVAGELEPKSLHVNRAALRAWAEFAEDPDLEKRLKRIKLPPARRAKPKRELERERWKELAAAIKTTKLRDPMRATLLIMARRGFRSGDVLRLRKTEISHAIKSGTLSFAAKGNRRIEYKATPIMEALETLHAQRGDWNRVEDLLVSPRCLSTGFDRRRAAAAAVSRALVKVAEAISESGVHPHRLRRTYAVYFLHELRGDPQAMVKLQHHMGWDSLTTAAGYVDAVNRDELDEIGDRLTKGLDS